MSCHNIGRGLNSVSKVVLELYEGNELSKSAVIRLIRACRRGVNWCDGNEYEAVDAVIEAGYCGLCFEKKGNLSSAFENGLQYPEKYDIFSAYELTAAHNYLCEDCKKRMIDEHKKTMPT